MLVKREILDCVAFLLYKDPSEKMHYVGTAFFLGDYRREIEQTFVYLITAKHVIAGVKSSQNDGYVYLRVNRVGGGTKIIPINIHSWQEHDLDPYADVVVHFGVPGGGDDLDIKCFPINSVVNDNILEKEDIGIGDETCLTGLFVNHFGKHQNLPIVRTGNIAMMKGEPVLACLGPTEVLMDAYLVETRSVGGLSGSPVFVHLGPIRRKYNPPKPRTDVFYLLGLAQGHWDERFYLGENEVINDGAANFQQEAVNKGIAIVTPITKAVEIINQDSIRLDREAIEREYINTKCDD